MRLESDKIVIETYTEIMDARRMVEAYRAWLKTHPKEVTGVEDEELERLEHDLAKLSKEW